SNAPDSLMKVSIPDFEKEGEGKSKHVMYKIKVKTGGEEWAVYRRYSDFYWLHKKLQQRYPELVPELPPKKWIYSALDEQILEKRKQGLEKYIQRIVSHPVLANDELVVSFLQAKAEHTG
uniref:designed CISK-PX domain n=1 Tax=synthetic construct TaxID=32630 RepID=UPI000588E8B2|nr:Chain A, designed CISK-PX domain [synthetic construct]